MTWEADIKDMTSSLDPRQILDECRDKGQGTIVPFPYESLFAVVDKLTKRVLELEDTIDNEIDLEARCAHAETRMKQLEGMLRESENALQRALGRYDALKMDFVALKKEVLPTTLREQVIEFHKAMHFPGTGEDLVVPKIPSDERVRLRASLIAEEFFETLMAMFTPQNSESVDAFDAARAAFNAARATIMVGMIGSASVRVHMSELADGLCDLAYVIEGTHLELGIDSSPLAAEVHRANMAKVGGPLSATGKQLKPEGWTPPDIEGELRKQGWKEEGKR